MPHIPFILADDFNGYGKLIGVAIVAIFWGINALSSLVKKANEQAKRNAALRPAQPISPPMPVAKSPGAAQRAVQQGRIANITAASKQVVPPQQNKRQAAAKRSPARPAQQTPPPIPLAQSAPVMRAVQPSAAKSGPMPANTPARNSGANAATIRRWLQPDTVRQQFILTELFQPPIALRQSRND